MISQTFITNAKVGSLVALMDDTCPFIFSLKSSIFTDLNRSNTILFHDEFVIVLDHEKKAFDKTFTKILTSQGIFWVLPSTRILDVLK